MKGTPEPVPLKLSPLGIQGLIPEFLIPWTKTELKAIAKDFPKVTEDPHRFAKEFNAVMQTYQPGFSDLHNLVHILINWVQTTNWGKC